LKEKGNNHDVLFWIAFGELDGYGAGLKYPSTDCIRIWGTPQSPLELADVFLKYITGQIESLPWCDSALQSETSVLTNRLKTIIPKGNDNQI
jgi:methylenetetrahydrofolate reductase (NADPH)